MLFLDTISDFIFITMALFHQVAQSVSFATHPPRPDNDFVSFLGEWQTIIAGLLAFLPASFAAIFVWRQLNEQRTQFLQIQTRDSMKARLKLSNNLSQISKHLDECYLLAIQQVFSMDKHSLPNHLLDDVLDAADTRKEHIFEFFVFYVEKIQTYSSRCELYAKIGGEDNLVKCFRNLAEIDIMTDELYPYARFEIEDLIIKPISNDDIKRYLSHNLRRGVSISGTNLEELLKLKCFDR